MRAWLTTFLKTCVNASRIADYEHSSSRTRYYFAVGIQRNPDYFAALEVKGGEGNSINISERPLWAKEFGIWCHLDGAIVNQPAHGAHSIVNRITNEMVRRHKLVDVLFFKDILCGTRTRPCLKYPNQKETIGLQAAPDIFLLPQGIPSLENPEPPVHSLDTLKLPALILDLFGVEVAKRDKHIWQVYVKVTELPDRRLQRVVQIVHQGQMVSESTSRAWRP